MWLQVALYVALKGSAWKVVLHQMFRSVGDGEEPLEFVGGPVRPVDMMS